MLANRHWVVIALAVLTLWAAGATWVIVGSRIPISAFFDGGFAPGPEAPVVGYQLAVEKIGVVTPIIPDISGTDERAYLKAIEGGVAHYGGTAKPGEIGNSFIFGHSSYYKNKPGDYKEVFKRLNEVAVGDLLTVRHEATTLRYRVFRSEIIPDNDLSVLDQPKEKELVTLMTCWPPGTLLKRYIVQAERLAGVPTPSPSVSLSSSLEGNRPFRLAEVLTYSGEEGD